MTWNTTSLSYRPNKSMNIWQFSALFICHNDSLSLSNGSESAFKCLWWRTAKNKLFSTKSRTRWEETWVYVQNYTQCIKRINTNIVKYDKSSSDADMLWSRSETLAVAVKPLYMVWRKESCVWGKTKQQWTKKELTAVWDEILRRSNNCT